MLAKWTSAGIGQRPVRFASEGVGIHFSEIAPTARALERGEPSIKNTLQRAKRKEVIAKMGSKAAPDFAAHAARKNAWLFERAGAKLIRNVKMTLSEI